MEGQTLCWNRTSSVRGVHIIDVMFLLSLQYWYPAFYNGSMTYFDY